MKQGLYLYCIVPGFVQGTWETNNLKFVPVQDIQALVEEVSLEEFWGENLKKNLEDLKWIESKVLRHNQVIGEAAQKWTTIPMKFGTVFESEESLQKTLLEKKDEFESLFKQLEGKEEWGVKVFCHIDKLKKYIMCTDQSIKDIDAAMKDKPEGVAYFLKRKKETLLAEANDKKINEYAAFVHEELAKMVDDSCLNKLQPKELTKKEAEMILNGAYLISKEKVDEFKSKVLNLQKDYLDQGLELELTGPWPAYSFASLDKK